jgi:hypothetical protein
MLERTILPFAALRSKKITASVGWFAMLRQEVTSLVGLGRSKGRWALPLAYIFVLLGVFYLKLRTNRRAENLGGFT